MIENKFPHWLSWGLIITFIVVNGYFLFPVFQYLRSTLILLMTATLLAFVLDYPVQLFMSWKIKRSYAIALVLLLALTILGVVTFSLLPLLLQQLDEFASRLPNWIDSESEQLQTFEIWITNQKLPFDNSELIIQLENILTTKMQVFPTYAIAFLSKTLDRTLELLIVLVLTFYLLTQGHDFWA